MVICTLLSAPMMFMSAQLITISKDYAAQIKRFGYGTSIAALVAIIWVFLVFLLTKKYKRMPHRLTLCLLASQVSSFLHDCDEAKKKGYDRKFGCFFPTFQVRSWFEILCSYHDLSYKPKFKPPFRCIIRTWSPTMFYRSTRQET